MRAVFLDAGPLGMISTPRGRPVALRCQQWARDLLAAGVQVCIPEIADYEVRRKLLHLGATSGIARLDRLQVGFDFAPIDRAVMLRAAELWAAARRAGLPTTSPDALDGDCILAAMAQLAADAGDVVTVATDNVGHLGQFVDARPWDQIAP
jgi:predicted nucleic acid-binding protein